MEHRRWIASGNFPHPLPGDGTIPYVVKTERTTGSAGSLREKSATHNPRRDGRTCNHNTVGRDYPIITPPTIPFLTATPGSIQAHGAAGEEVRGRPLAISEGFHEPHGQEIAPVMDKALLARQDTKELERSFRWNYLDRTT